MIASKKKWLAERGSASGSSSKSDDATTKQHQKGAEEEEENEAKRSLAELPMELPRPPRGFVMRESVMAQSHEALLGTKEAPPKLCENLREHTASMFRAQMETMSPVLAPRLPSAPRAEASVFGH